MDAEDRALRDQQVEILEQADRDIARAQDAKMLLENPLLIEALDLIERTWEAAWRNTKIGDVAGREKAYAILLGLTEFKTELQTAIETGRLAVQTTDAIRGGELGSSGDRD